MATPINNELEQAYLYEVVQEVFRKTLKEKLMEVAEEKVNEVVQELGDEVDLSLMRYHELDKMVDKLIISVLDKRHGKQPKE